MKFYNTLFFNFSAKVMKIRKPNSVLKFDAIIGRGSPPPPRDIPLRLAECFPYI